MVLGCSVSDFGFLQGSDEELRQGGIQVGTFFSGIHLETTLCMTSLKTLTPGNGNFLHAAAFYPESASSPAQQLLGRKSTKLFGCNSSIPAPYSLKALLNPYIKAALRFPMLRPLEP